MENTLSSVRKEPRWVFRMTRFRKIFPLTVPKPHYYYKRYERNVQRRQHHVHHRTLPRTKQNNIYNKKQSLRI